MDELREAIARAVFRGSLSPDPRNDRYLLEDSLFRDRHYETADAVLAVLRERGLLRDGPDLSAMLTEAAEMELRPTVTIPLNPQMTNHGWMATLSSKYGKPAITKTGETPEAAVEAALAAAREAAR